MVDPLLSHAALPPKAVVSPLYKESDIAKDEKRVKKSRTKVGIKILPCVVNVEL